MTFSLMSGLVTYCHINNVVDFNLTIDDCQ
jgi:hypothetical protein